MIIHMQLGSDQYRGEDGANDEIREQFGEAVIAGDQDLIVTLLTPHIDAAFRSILVMGERWAEDAVQDALVQVLSGRCRYDGRGSVRSWFVGISIRCARQRCRSESRRQRRHERAAVQGLMNEEKDTSMDTEIQEDMKAALAALPEQYRIPVQLRYLEDFSFEEIAAALDLRQRTARTRVQRGLQRLRDQLAPSYVHLASEGALVAALSQQFLQQAPAHIISNAMLSSASLSIAATSSALVTKLSLSVWAYMGIAASVLIIASVMVMSESPSNSPKNIVVNSVVLQDGHEIAGDVALAHHPEQEQQNWLDIGINASGSVYSIIKQITATTGKKVYLCQQLSGLPYRGSDLGWNEKSVQTVLREIAELLGGELYLTSEMAVIYKNFDDHQRKSMLDELKNEKFSEQRRLLVLSEIISSYDSELLKYLLAELSGSDMMLRALIETALCKNLSDNGVVYDAVIPVAEVCRGDQAAQAGVQAWFKRCQNDELRSEGRLVALYLSSQFNDRTDDAMRLLQNLSEHVPMVLDASQPEQTIAIRSHAHHCKNIAYLFPGHVLTDAAKEHLVTIYSKLMRQSPGLMLFYFHLEDFIRNEMSSAEKLRDLWIDRLSKQSDAYFFSSHKNRMALGKPIVKALGSLINQHTALKMLESEPRSLALLSELSQQNEKWANSPLKEICLSVLKDVDAHPGLRTAALKLLAKWGERKSVSTAIYDSLDNMGARGSFSSDQIFSVMQACDISLFTDELVKLIEYELDHYAKFGHQSHNNSGLKLSQELVPYRGPRHNVMMYCLALERPESVEPLVERALAVAPSENKPLLWATMICCKQTIREAAVELCKQACRNDSGIRRKSNTYVMPVLNKVDPETALMLAQEFREFNAVAELYQPNHNELFKQLIINELSLVSNKWSGYVSHVADALIEDEEGRQLLIDLLHEQRETNIGIRLLPYMFFDSAARQMARTIMQDKNRETAALQASLDLLRKRGGREDWADMIDFYKKSEGAHADLVMQYFLDYQPGFWTIQGQRLALHLAPLLKAGPGSAVMRMSILEKCESGLRLAGYTDELQMIQEDMRALQPDAQSAKTKRKTLKKKKREHATPDIDF